MHSNASDVALHHYACMRIAQVLCMFAMGMPTNIHACLNSSDALQLLMICCLQKYTLGGYDILFATNVLHATRNMPNTLQNCKALLRKGGLLIANELTTKTEFLTLTFGLTNGWWLHDDTGIRITGSPLISRHATAFWCSQPCLLPSAMTGRLPMDPVACHMSPLCGACILFLL